MKNEQTGYESSGAWFLLCNFRIAMRRGAPFFSLVEFFSRIFSSRVAESAALIYNHPFSSRTLSDWRTGAAARKCF
jgi:hypothetical protein